jgi:hypothetical protein
MFAIKSRAVRAILANPIGIYVTFFNEIEEKAEQ